MAQRSFTTDIFITLLAPLIWGSTYLITTEMLPDGRPLLAAFLRALPAGLILLLISRRWLQGEWWWRVAILGALNIGAFFYFLFMSAYLLPGGVAALIANCQPVLVLLLARLLLAEQVRPRQWAACAVGITGVALLVLQPGLSLNTAGVLAGLAAAASMATGIVLTKRWGRPEGMSLLNLTGWQLTLGGLLLLPVLLWQEGLPETLSGLNVAGYSYLALFGALIAYSLWFRGIERLPASTLSFMSLGSPLCATLLGWVVLGEALTPMQLLGAAAIVGTLWLARPAATKAVTPDAQPDDPRIPTAQTMRE